MASRTQRTEVVSGLMNVVTLPMFVVSGVLFSSDRFPQALQPLVRALPLTALNDSLRAVILEGEPLSAQRARLAVLLAWGAASFLLALRFFRWNGPSGDEPPPKVAFRQGRIRANLAFSEGHLGVRRSPSQRPFAIGRGPGWPGLLVEVPATTLNSGWSSEGTSNKGSRL